MRLRKGANLEEAERAFEKARQSFDVLVGDAIKAMDEGVNRNEVAYGLAGMIEGYGVAPHVMAAMTAFAIVDLADRKRAGI